MPAGLTPRNSVDAVADLNIEALGLLDGLEGEAREERAQLIAWLLDRGFSMATFALRSPLR